MSDKALSQFPIIDATELAAKTEVNIGIITKPGSGIAGFDDERIDLAELVIYLQNVLNIQNASTTVKGVVEEGTQDELENGDQTGGTGARLFFSALAMLATFVRQGTAAPVLKVNASSLIADDGQTRADAIASGIPFVTIGAAEAVAAPNDIIKLQGNFVGGLGRDDVKYDGSDALSVSISNLFNILPNPTGQSIMCYNCNIISTLSAVAGGQISLIGGRVNISNSYGLSINSAFYAYFETTNVFSQIFVIGTTDNSQFLNCIFELPVQINPNVSVKFKSNLVKGQLTFTGAQVIASDELQIINNDFNGPENEAILDLGPSVLTNTIIAINNTYSQANFATLTSQSSLAPSSTNNNPY